MVYNIACLTTSELREISGVTLDLIEQAVYFADSWGNPDVKITGEAIWTKKGTVHIFVRFLNGVQEIGKCHARSHFATGGADPGDIAAIVIRQVAQHLIVASKARRHLRTMITNPGEGTYGCGWMLEPSRS